MEDAIRCRSVMAAIREFDHPAIVRVVDIGEQFNMPYVVTTRTEAQSLMAMLAKGALAIEDALRYMLDLYRALEYANGRGIVHWHTPWACHGARHGICGDVHGIGGGRFPELGVARRI